METLASRQSIRAIRDSMDISKLIIAAYSKGILPPAHIHARAKRPIVKLFLSHWHKVAYQVHYGEKPPSPYAIEHLGHVHEIPVPNWD